MLDFIKIKNFLCEDTVKKNKPQTEKNKPLQNTQKGLLSKIYKEFFKLNN